MTAEEKAKILSEARETLRRTEHIKTSVRTDPPPPEDRIARWKREADEQTAREEAEVRARQRRERQETHAAAGDGSAWASWVEQQIGARAAVLTDATGQFVGQVREELREEFESKYAELKRELERERTNHQRELERQAAESRRERDGLQKQIDAQQQLRVRELLTIEKGLARVEERIDGLGSDLFGGSAESVWDALGAAWDRHHQTRSNKSGEIIELPDFMARRLVS
jgi:hypothetical protein